MFQKGCTDKVKSFCFEAEKFKNVTTGQDEWTKVLLLFKNVTEIILSKYLFYISNDSKDHGFSMC